MKWLSKPFRDNVKFKAGEAVLAVEGWGWPRNIWSLVYALMQGKLRRIRYGDLLKENPRNPCYCSELLQLQNGSIF